MPVGKRGFSAGENWNGNKKGRPRLSDVVERVEKTRSQLGSDELNLILRRLKPLSKVALTKLGIILEEGSESAKMKAIVLILNEYKDLVNQLYIDSEEESDGQDLEPAEVKPLFSLVMDNKEKL